MIGVSVDFKDTDFMADMKGMIQYSIGYLEGVELGRTKLLQGLGKNIKMLLQEFIDVNARVDPQRLHHVYEWYMAGSPSARLFEIDYVISGAGLSIGSSFRQSTSLSNGSSTPFYDKAKIMESGVPVTIKPKKAKALSFELNGEQVFTAGPVEVSSPGGQEVEGAFNDVVDNFFKNYLTQSFLSDSGFTRHLKNPIDYKTHLSKSRTGGKSAGKEVGYNWITKAGGDI